MGQYEAELLEQEAGVPVSVLVLHNVYGAPTDYTAEKGQVIPSLVRKAIRAPEEPFVVWGSGSQGRAFVHVDDVVDALVSAASRGLGQGAIQIGPDACTTIREVAETVVEISEKDIAIEYDLTAPEGDRGRRADYTKAREVLGWTPTVSLRDGIAELYEWMEPRVAGLEPWAQKAGSDSPRQVEREPWLRGRSAATMRRPSRWQRSPRAAEVPATGLRPSPSSRT